MFVESRLAESPYSDVIGVKIFFLLLVDDFRDSPAAETVFLGNYTFLISSLEDFVLILLCVLWFMGDSSSLTSAIVWSWILATIGEAGDIILESVPTELVDEDLRLLLEVRSYITELSTVASISAIWLSLLVEFFKI